MITIISDSAITTRIRIVYRCLLLSSFVGFILYKPQVAWFWPRSTSDNKDLKAQLLLVIWTLLNRWQLHVRRWLATLWQMKPPFYHDKGKHGITTNGWVHFGWLTLLKSQYFIIKSTVYQYTKKMVSTLPLFHIANSFM